MKLLRIEPAKDGKHKLQAVFDTKTVKFGAKG